jgi:hypothetical protein
LMPCVRNAISLRSSRETLVTSYSYLKRLSLIPWSRSVFQLLKSADAWLKVSKRTLRVA